LNLDPSDALARVNRIEVLGYMGKCKEALDLIDIELVTWNCYGWLILYKGQMLNALGLTGGFDYIFKALEMNEKLFPGWYNKAEYHLELKDYDNALLCINKALEFCPTWDYYLKFKMEIESCIIERNAKRYIE
jgi:tetratricopeptide (TPR) repeat protein